MPTLLSREIQDPMGEKMAQTIREFILLEYSKLVSGGKDPGQLEKIFGALQESSEQCMRILSEDLEMKESRCAYCLSQDGLSNDGIVAGRECATSEFNNTVKICHSCKASKLNRDL